MLSSSIKYPQLLFIWLFPIIVAASTGRLRQYGVDSSIIYLLAGSIGFGGLYALFCMYRVGLSKNIILIISIIFPLMLLSDFTEFKLVTILAIYSLVVHMISRRFPSVLWNQYYVICMIISWMTIIDVVYFFFMDEVIFSYVRDRLHIYNGLPRVSTFFDEMSHQAFFLMPAAILAFQRNYKHFLLLFFGVLLPLSVQALLLFIPLLIYFNWAFVKKSLTLFILFIFSLILFSTIFYLLFDVISSKLEYLINPEILLNKTKIMSATNILMSFDFFRGANIYDILIGFGYFGNEGSVRYAFESSILYDYYVSMNTLDDVSMVGIVNFIMQFGLIVSGLVLLLIYSAKKNAIDKTLYSVSIIVVLASMLKNSHTVDYFVHLFFLFGLAWSCRNEMMKATDP